ncbi:ShlB/FhaC/HecB family hemolysin secretion/activation protein [Comamonas flocculans]|nr:ShlB/FhaC/HecB family hemolysin secretion/activation protein [Comamonas flocculans]
MGSAETAHTAAGAFWRALAAAAMLAWAGAAHAEGEATAIERFEVGGNTLLESAAVARALGPAPGSMTVAQMQAAAQRLQDAYRAAGWGAVLVLLPEQSLSDKVLHLQVVEGKLRQVNVTGQQRYSRENVLRSLPSLQPGTTPSLADLDRELLMVNDNPGKFARVVLQPGEATGEVDALVSVQERPLLPWQWSLDNTGAPGTGALRATLLYQNANVADRDLVWGVRAATSPTHPSRASALGTTLRLPLYAQKLAIEGALIASNTRSASNLTPAGELRFSGSGLSAGARAVWMLPSLGETKSQLALGFDARVYRTRCGLGEFGAAGCGDTLNNTMHALPLTLSWTAHKLGSYLLRAQWVANLPVGSAGRDADYEANRPGARSRYQLLRLDGEAQARLAPRWALGVRASAQYAPRALVAAEQFGIGGMGSVRGYAERELVGDAGLAASLELRSPLGAWVSGGASGSELLPVLALFVDAGQVSNHLDTQCLAARTRCSLWSAGASAQWSLNQRGLLRIDLARAGADARDTRKGDWKLHFSLSYSL